MGTARTCTVDDCGNVHYGRGYCQKHWQSARRNGEFDTGPCEVAGCDRKVHSRGRCGLHYSRLRNGDLVDDGPRRRGNGRAVIRVDGLKECGICFEWKPEANFTARVASGDSLSSVCRECVRHQGWQRRWGLLPGDIQDRVEKQGGCAVCHTFNPGTKGWCVDHDHTCCPGNASCGSCIRGILCGSCNLALGQFKDDAEVARSAATYLETWKEVLL